MRVIQPQKPGEAHKAAALPPSTSSNFRAGCLGLFAAAAAWLSQGVTADAHADRARLVLLSITPPVVILSLAAGAAVFALCRAGASRAPLWLLGLVLLPWLPLRVPAAFLVWTSPMSAAVWVVVFGSMLSTVRWNIGRAAKPRPVVRAGLLALLVYAAAAWGVSPSLPGGDEPHYLIITQSLLLDRDLRIENNHTRGDYRSYFAGDLSKPDYLRRGRDGQIYSIHAPGLAALIAPAFQVAGYRGVVLFLLGLSALAAALAWELARRVTGRTDAAWFGWAAVVLSPTLLLNSFTVYPDGPGALLVLTGIWALIRSREERTSAAESAWPWFLHGAAIAMLPWLHTRFALLAGSIGALVMLDLGRTRNAAAKAVAFLVVPTVSAIAWIAFFIAIYGAPDPAIPYRGSDLGSPAYITGGLGGIFFDQMYGLLANAPALIAAPIGLVALAWRRGPYWLLSAQIAFVGLPYVLTVTHFAMWWGGYSSPARFLVPLLPMLAVPAAVAWADARSRSVRTWLAGALLVTGCLSAVLVFVERGRLAYFDRGGIYAAWLEWANRSADLAHGLPAYFARVQRQRPGGLFFAEAAIWIAALAAACLAVRALERRGRLTAPGAMAAAMGGATAAAVMVAVTAVWSLERVDGRTAGAAAMNVLREVGQADRALALDLTGARVLSTTDLVRRLEVELAPVSRPGGAAREDRALFLLPRVPAGEYRLRPVRAPGDGWLMAGVGAGRDQFALVTEPLAVYDGEVTLRFPVDVRAIVVRGDEDARGRVGALVVRPVSVRTSDQKVAEGVARRAVRYGAATAFFMDERSFPEPAGFWVGGARASTVVLQPEPAGTGRASIALGLRNAPVENVVSIVSGGWREQFRMAPGEERRVDVPLDQARGAASLTFDIAAGFRPSAADPASRDTRFLGLWIKVE